jgi:enoyl-CoA hydratase
MENSGGLVVLQRAGPIATVVLNRPHKLNAMNLAMAEELGSVFHRLSGDDALRCVVLRGAGRAFCSGADIAEFGEARASRADAEKFAHHFHSTLSAVANLPCPVVAVIRGACIGGGLQLACLCDLRISGESGRFGIPVNRLGLTVDFEELRAIYGVVGEPNLLQLLLEGRVISASEACNKGLLARIVPDDRLDEEARLTAENIAAGAPLANRWHKKFVRRLADPTPLSANEIAESFSCFETHDYQIGCDAFLTKTKPVWEGR